LIVDLLLQKDKPVLYMQLYNSVKGARKKLSHETFDIYLSHLKENGLVEKTTKAIPVVTKHIFCMDSKS
jgi:Fe2+ or Zn2+ uptake regulation protein